jgi:outer membrane receptor protein involved in Fe transport
LILPAGAVGTALGDQIIIAQNPNGTVFVPASTSPVLVRANFDDARIYGFEHTLNVQLTDQFSASTIFTYIHARDKRTGLPPNIEGGTPAPEAYLKVKYTHGDRRFWIEPYIHGAWQQNNLSSLDLEDRRTGASRSVSSITNFFNNGARARGLVSPGLDGIFGSADDFLIASGETLAQILQRVLGPGLHSSSLFTSIPGYATLNVRLGFNISRSHELLMDFYNITDKNYRGISWGLDAPGRGIFVRLGSAF